MSARTQRPLKKPRKFAQDQPKPEITAQDTDLIWGINPVHEFLSNRPTQVKEVDILKSKTNPRLQQIIDLARAQGIRVHFKDELHLPKGSGNSNHQGVMARTLPMAVLTIEELLASQTEDAGPPLLIALDSIQDPHNLGAIIRSASAAGVTGIIVPRDRTAPLSGVAVKVAAGALAHVRICMVTNLVTGLKKLQENGIWIYGTDAQATTSVFRTDLTGPACLVIGGEGKGLRPLVREHCDFTVSIPMHSQLDSLNASVAAAIVLFEAVRQRDEWIKND